MRVVSSPQKLSRKVESGKMSPEFLKEHCRKNDLYMIPHFNTILYLHHKVRYLLSTSLLIYFCSGI